MSGETESVVDDTVVKAEGGDWPGLSKPQLIYENQTYTNITSALGPRAHVS